MTDNSKHHRNGLMVELPIMLHFQSPHRTAALHTTVGWDGGMVRSPVPGIKIAQHFEKLDPVC